MAVSRDIQNNTKSIHTRARIHFYINGQCVKSLSYFSPLDRQKKIDAFRMLYPPQRNQIRYFQITPNWDLWQSKEV